MFFFSITERSELMAFSVLLQRYVRKGNNAKSLTILSFFFATERTQFNGKS